MTFVAISTILVIGAPVIDDARENAQLEKTQVELATLDQQIRESVYTQDSPGGSITLSEGGISVKPESLTVNFTYDNGTDTVTVNTTPGGMEYEHENIGVAYQNGGVWTEYRTGGTTVQSPPDMTYTGRTLTANLLNFTNTVEVSGSGASVSISHQGVNVTKFSEIMSGASENGTLVITVGTEYSEAWAEHLNRTGIEDVAVSGDRVRVEMRTGPPIFAVEYLGDRYEGDPSALPVCLSPPLPPICSGSTTNVSLYDSRIGNVSDYSYTVDTDTVVSPSGVDDPIDPHPVTTTDIADIIASPPAGLQTFPSSPAVVDEGEYEVSSSSDNLKDYTFDTTQGSITLYVTGGSSLNIKNVSVEGGSPVYVYAQDPDIDDPGVNADGTGLFQLYTNDDSLTIEADYNGTVYAPDADVEIDTPSAGEVRGAVIAEDVKVDPGVEYYHDTSLRQAELPDELSPPLSRFKAAERFLEIR
jgi:hypothetical protein